MSTQAQQSALPFFWDLFRRQARDAPAKIANAGKMIGAGTAGLLGDVQSAVPGSPRYAPTTEAVAEKINADPSGYGGLLGQVIAPGPGEFKGLLGGAKALAKGLASQPGGFGGLLGMTLFHGTPHKFDMFELSPKTIGTGEGRQQQAHGLFFAENSDVAKSYQLKLSDGSGHLYEIEIPDELMNNMLDLDAPLSKQSDGVIESIKKAIGEDGINAIKADFGDDPTAKQVYHRIAEWESAANFGPPGSWDNAAASDLLKNNGIPGAKYFDQYSVGPQSGTRNVVLFDTNHISRVKRDGTLVYKR